MTDFIRGCIVGGMLTVLVECVVCVIIMIRHSR